MPGALVTSPNSFAKSLLRVLLHVNISQETMGSIIISWTSASLVLLSVALVMEILTGGGMEGEV